MKTKNIHFRGLLIVFPVLFLAVAFSGVWVQAVRVYSQAPASPRTVRRHCGVLPMAAGNVVHVDNVTGLVDAVNHAAVSTTILLADGNYSLDGAYLRIDTAGVTLRSASGNPDAVVLDGNYLSDEIIQIVASNATVADLTIRRAVHHPIHVMSTSSADVTGTLIYNVHIIDPGQQAIKINPVDSAHFPDDGTVACSVIRLTNAGRSHIHDDCYTGGIDAHQARGWLIRDNLIEGFWCESGLSEHGIHFWRGSRDTLIERNQLMDNARGIGLGLTENGSGRTYADNPCPGAGGGFVEHYGGMIRNNFVSAGSSALFASAFGFDCGICLAQACGAKVLHNSVASTVAPFSSIEWRFGHTSAEIRNNLVSHNLRDRGGSAVLSDNRENVPMASFVDVAGGDLHLKPHAVSYIDQVSLLPEVRDDFDGDERPAGSAADIGADEYVLPVPQAIGDLRLTDVISKGGVLTFTLHWTPPQFAITTTLRYSGGLISDENWHAASVLTDSLTGTRDFFSDAVSVGHATIYFALKTQNTNGDWSGVSNNAFYPGWFIFLPLAAKASGLP